MKPLSIAYLGQGNSSYIFKLAEDMAKRKHHVSVIASEQYKPFPEIYEVQFYTFPQGKNQLSKLKKIREIITQISPDILHSHFINYGGLLGMATGFHPHIASAWGCDVLNVPQISSAEKIKVLLTLR